MFDDKNINSRVSDFVRMGVYAVCVSEKECGKINFIKP